MIWFIGGLLVGGSAGFLLAAIVADSRAREDAHLNGLLLRVVRDDDPTIWPYRHESRVDDNGAFVRTYYEGMRDCG